MLSWKLSVLEIPLEKELTANCLVETRTKLKELIPAAMVKYGLNMSTRQTCIFCEFLCVSLLFFLKILNFDAFALIRKKCLHLSRIEQVTWSIGI